jgi:hypothetical protein
LLTICFNRDEAVVVSVAAKPIEVDRHLVEVVEEELRRVVTSQERVDRRRRPS